MAVKNTLTKQEVENKAVEFVCNGEKVKLSPNIIRNYLVSGDPNAVTDQEIVMFLNLCRFQHLNPFLREAYLIKYGGAPATLVTGKEVFTKRAKRNPDYRGFKAGIIVIRDGELAEREGTFYLSGEELVGGWAEVYIDGFAAPIKVTVSLDEYVGTKKSGEINGQWSKKPATMIRKVALVQALREAFPEDFTGMHSQEEAVNEDIILDESPVEVQDVEYMEMEAPPEDDPLA